MPKIEDYALLSDTQGAALVCADGSIDWLCLPRFDSPASFAALLGTAEHGRWLVAPAGPADVTRRYLPGSMVLETTFTSESGAATVTDALLMGAGRARALVRIVRGRRGRVAMRTEFILRPEYGSLIPWVERRGSRLQAIAGPDAFCLDADVSLRGERWRTVADFDVEAGAEVCFVLQWHSSQIDPPPPLNAPGELERTVAWWRAWAARGSYRGRYAEAVGRSLLTLKALTFAPTGGIIAAPTASLPEEIGGVRNWDYRYCWIRDAAFTLRALLNGGYVEEANAWRDWLLRAAAGHPAQLQVVYGVAGERRIPEQELPWLPGFAGSAPVRIGNAAHGQFQLDIYGEVVDMLSTARAAGMAENPLADRVAETLLEFLEGAWQRPDDGIWEVRGGPRHFTHSKVMAWVAADRAGRALTAVKASEATHWVRLRDRIHADVMTEGVHPDRGVFVQSYGADRLDASLLVLPLVGFLPATHPLVAATVNAIEEKLTIDGFVRRYEPDPEVEGLPGEEGAFLLTTLWLAQAEALLGRRDQAEQRFERVLAIANDVGLLAEEYDPAGQRMLGNFPQAFSHIEVINTAHLLDRLTATRGR